MIYTFDPLGLTEGFINLREIIPFSFRPLSPILCSPFAHCSCTFSITSSFWTEPAHVGPCSLFPEASLLLASPPSLPTPVVVKARTRPGQTCSLIGPGGQWCRAGPSGDVRKHVPHSHNAHPRSLPLLQHPPASPLTLLHDLSPSLPEAAWLQGWNSTEG